MSSRFRRSLHFPDLRPAERPADLSIKVDHSLFGLADFAGVSLNKRLSLLGLSARSKEDIRNTLLAWCADVSDALNDSSRAGAAADHLAEAWPLRHAEMLAWLRADWSTREALAELCWRLQFHPTLISAVLWLYDLSEPPSESRREAVFKAS